MATGVEKAWAFRSASPSRGEMFLWGAFWVTGYGTDSWRRGAGGRCMRPRRGAVRGSYGSQDSQGPVAGPPLSLLGPGRPPVLFGSTIVTSKQRRPSCY